MKQKQSRGTLTAIIAAAVAAVVIMGAVIIGTLPEKRFKLIFIPKVIDEHNDFWTSLTSGVKMAAKEYEADIIVDGGSKEEDVARQNELIEWAIAQSPDALLISPCSYSENTAHIKKAADAGIRIVLIDSLIDADLGQSIVATDNVLAGATLGRFAKSLAKGDDTHIGIVGHVKGTSTAIEREKGVMEGLGELKDNVENVVFCGSSFSTAYSLTMKIMRDTPQTNMLIGLNEYSSVGTARAIRDMQLEDKVTVVGFDSSKEEVSLTEAGIFKGIVVQEPFKMGYLGVEQAIKLLKHSASESTVDSGCKLITLENLYEKENQKLLFPFNG